MFAYQLATRNGTCSRHNGDQKMDLSWGIFSWATNRQGLSPPSSSRALDMAVRRPSEINNQPLSEITATFLLICGPSRRH
jgi:hypothetical protein